jgi:DnaJ-class molecular chaperone
MAERDLYADLGLARGASKDEIKKAYRKLARELHPDRNPNNPKAEERFKRVAYAADVLGDDRKRGLYDEFGEMGLREGFDAEMARAASRFRRPGGPPGIDDLFTQVNGGRGGRRAGFGSTLEDLFGGGIDELFGRSAGAARPGARVPDQESDIEVAFEEALKGVEKELSIRESGGAERTIRVRIPAGVTDGGKVRLRGQGALMGTERGDLVLTVRVKEHPWFRRDGSDLHLDLPITIGEAWTGASIKVPTLEGEVTVRIPARVQSGGKLRLKGKGAPERGGGHGDLFVHLQVRLPTGSDAAAITRAVEELERHYAGDLRAAFKLPQR